MRRSFPALIVLTLCLFACATAPRPASSASGTASGTALLWTPVGELHEVDGRDVGTNLLIAWVAPETLNVPAGRRRIEVRDIIGAWGNGRQITTNYGIWRLEFDAAPGTVYYLKTRSQEGEAPRVQIFDMGPDYVPPKTPKLLGIADQDFVRQLQDAERTGKPVPFKPVVKP